MAVDWSQAPATVQVTAAGPATSTLRDRKLWRAASAPDTPPVWAAEWRSLMLAWVKLSRSETVRWTTLLNTAASATPGCADAALLGLVEAGIVELDVRRKGRANVWLPVEVRWLRLPQLRQWLGLPDPALQRGSAEALLASPPLAPVLQDLFASLCALPTPLILRRHALLVALDTWVAERRCGTFRDLAQLARDDTKDLTSTERDWLAQYVDLEALGLEAHQPVFWLSGDARLFCTDVPVLDLCTLGGAAALSLPALLGIDGAEPPKQITLVENRTSFERLAVTSGALGHLAVWLPGYVGDRWLKGLRHLLDVLGAPCRIAADCDPWGVEIALRCGAACAAAGVAWQPWRMDAATLQGCKHRLPLTAADRARLEGLAQIELPPALRELCQAMADMGEKAEQEQYL